MSVGMRLGDLVGIGAYYLLGSERRKAHTHILIAFGKEKSPKDVKRIAKASFRNLAKNAVELVNLPRIRGNIDSHFFVEGEEYLQQAFSQGSGVLWITGHIGNWELMGFYWAARGYPINVIARRVYDTRLNDLLMRFRQHAGVNTIFRDTPQAGREILKALKGKEILAMLIDQDTKVKGVMVDFFGQKANTPAGAAILATKRAVPVIAGFINRMRDGRHRIEIYPPIELVHTEDFKKDIEQNTQRFNQIIERHIQEFPEDWIWIHRRWRRRVPYAPAVAQKEAHTDQSLS